MDFFRKIKLECIAVPLVLKGIPHQIGRRWFWWIQEDKSLRAQKFDSYIVAYWRRRGYLVTSIERWGLKDKRETDRISDFEYCCLTPINSSFSKWLTDMLTTRRVMLAASQHFRVVHFSIIQREDHQLILKDELEDQEYTVSDVLSVIRQEGSVELRPSWWNSTAPKYHLSYEQNGLGQYYCNGEIVDTAEIAEIISELNSNYVLTEMVSNRYEFSGMWLDHELIFWIANDISEDPQIMAAEIYLYREDVNSAEGTEPYIAKVDLEAGTFSYNNESIIVHDWNELKRNICQDASLVPQLALYSASVVLNDDVGYTYLSFSGYPSLPRLQFADAFNAYLKNKYNTLFKKNTAREQMAALGRKVRFIERIIVSRKGMRPYMYGLWRKAAWDDLIHNKGVLLPRQLWAHRHGFFSWRLYQYGLTKENYSDFLSDYDYYWLNRINNHYQIWINDKTTFRYVMEPFKEFIPQYYFSVYRRSGKNVISKMWDCPDNVPEGFEGILEMLRAKGKLAFKASSGTHGDGFYCLAYEDGILYANGKQLDKYELKKLVEDMETFYVVTEYSEMHHEIKKIYPKSVNTVRMMVVNDHGYDPRILQTYMRIGAGNLGFTDNVGYGGICAFVNKDTGELYNPETIKDHVFYDCPVHPNTGVAIAGRLPHWDLVKRKICEISKYLCELEYLGFDIAITENGFNILEINIHQDLHKVACFDEDIKEYFRRKIENKYKLLNQRIC